MVSPVVFYLKDLLGDDLRVVAFIEEAMTIVINLTAVEDCCEINRLLVETKVANYVVFML